MKLLTKVWIYLGVLTLVSPLGIIIPAYFKAGKAWGEEGTHEIKNLIGYLPAGMVKISSLWHAPLPDYGFRGMINTGLMQVSLNYILSAILGIAVCSGGAFLIGKILTRKKP